MKNIILLIFISLLGLSSNAQMQGQMRRNNMNRIPQTQTEPSEQEIAKRKRQMEERKDEYITNFTTTLEGDEFQKEIVKQSLLSFYDEKIAIFKTPFDRAFERQEAIKKLENSHFIELQELISESDMAKIKEMIKGEFDEKEVKKKQKKRRKKRRG